MTTAWKPKPGDKIIRHPREDMIGPVHHTVTDRQFHSSVFASPLVLVYVFAGLILTGTILLMLPVSHHGDDLTPFTDALFTATSATTVTGLVTQNTAEYWTKFGQIIILGLIFIGGLGFMSIATFLLLLVGQRVTLTQRLLVKESLQIDKMGGLVKLATQIVLVATGIQLLGFIGLTFWFSLSYPLEEALWQGASHAISAFNNAGFIFLPDGERLAAFQTDKIFLGILAILIFLGAIGYWVMVDVMKLHSFSLYTLNTKLVLVMTFALIVIGALFFFASEYANEETIGILPLGDKISISLFESISGRTAGFSTVDFGETEKHTNFFFTSLMFIGGASASVAGGIKVNTTVVILIALLCTFRGSSNATAFGRQIPRNQIQKATALVSAGLVLVFVTTLALTFSESTQDFKFIDLLFESVSAFGTVGLSAGVTEDLSGPSHLILSTSMFLGRVGLVTLALAIVHFGKRDLYTYAQERVTLG